MAERALPMTIQGSTPAFAEATRVMEPWRVWDGSSLIGMSAFRNLRPGQPRGYGIGEGTTSLDLALMPCALASDVHSHRRSHRNSNLTCRPRESSCPQLIAPARIVAAASGRHCGLQ